MAGTLKEIAEKADVSLATASRVFTGKGYVKEETRVKIMDIASEMSFSPKQYNKQKKQNEFQETVGVVIPDISNLYYMEVIHGIENVMDEHGIEVIICNTDEDPNKEIRALTMLHDMQIGGIVTVPVSSNVVYNSEYLIDMNNSEVPIVLLDRDLRGGNMDGVFMDNYNSAYQSIQTFIRNGHQEIAIICGPTTSSSALARLNGYFEALKQDNIRVKEEYILYGDFKFICGYELTKKLVEKQKRVTAVFVSNSRMACGALLAFAEKGMKIPDDISLIACGRLDIINSCPISCVEYPTTAIGEECARILIEKIRMEKKTKNTPKKRVTFDMELVLRGSEVFPKNRISEMGNKRI